MSVTKHVAIAIGTICLVFAAESTQVTKSVEDDYDDSVNTTTLYPVDKNPFIKSPTEQTEVKKIKETSIDSDKTSWNINATFAMPRYEYQDAMVTDKATTTHKLLSAKACNHLRHTELENNDNDDLFAIAKRKNESDLNKLKTIEYKVNTTKLNENEKDEVLKKEFKPSPHLYSYYGTIDDSFHNYLAAAPPLGRPIFSGQQTHDWSGRGLQPAPTVEAPVRIPAGGMYGLPASLKQNPISHGEDDDSIQNIKEISLNKRAGPWRSLLRLVTALLPLGLIISALSPSVITIQNSGSDSQYKRASRRLDQPAAFPSLSDECKRRLLCEIHSDSNYQGKSPYHRPKHCYKIHCEDPHAISNLLHWLLSYHRSRSRWYT